MTERKYQNDDYELRSNEYPVCPYCGEKDRDYEWVSAEDGGESSAHCVNCDKEYSCTTHVEWTFTTYT